MTLFIDLKEKIKKFFVLKEEKSNDNGKIWGNYLRNESSYVNGAVYICETVPTVHKQEPSFILFNVQDNNLVCVIGAKNNESFSEKQLRRTVVTFNNTLHSVKSVTASGNTAQLVFDNFSSSGNLKVQIPSYNDKGNVYRGLTFTRQIVAQSMTLTPITLSSREVRFSVLITNPYPLQQLRVSTLYRTGQTNNVMIITLPQQIDNPHNITVDLIRGSQDVSVFAELIPYTVGDTVYTGYGVKKSFGEFGG